MTTTAKTHLCIDCADNVEDSRYAACSACRAKHKAAWIEEHSRIAANGTRRTNKEWMIGDECQVTIWGVLYLAKILDMTDVSRHDDGNYDRVTLEVTRTWTAIGWNGEELSNTKTWTYHEPIQRYKLRKRYIK